MIHIRQIGMGFHLHLTQCTSPNMKKRMMRPKHLLRLETLLSVSLFPCTALLADVPNSIHYQGEVSVDSEPFDGTGYFKFALVDDGTENVSPATATANVNAGLVTSLSVDAGGSGYTSPPDVTLTGGGGAKAVFEAIVESGVVTHGLFI